MNNYNIIAFEDFCDRLYIDDYSSSYSYEYDIATEAFDGLKRTLSSWCINASKWCNNKANSWKSKHPHIYKVLMSLSIKLNKLSKWIISKVKTQSDMDKAQDEVNKAKKNMDDIKKDMDEKSSSGNMKEPIIPLEKDIKTSRETIEWENDGKRVYEEALQLATRLENKLTLMNPNRINYATNQHERELSDISQSKKTLNDVFYKLENHLKEYPGKTAGDEALKSEIETKYHYVKDRINKIEEKIETIYDEIQTLFKEYKQKSQEENKVTNIHEKNDNKQKNWKELGAKYDSDEWVIKREKMSEHNNSLLENIKYDIKRYFNELTLDDFSDFEKDTQQFQNLLATFSNDAKHDLPLIKKLDKNMADYITHDIKKYNSGLKITKELIELKKKQKMRN